VLLPLGILFFDRGLGGWALTGGVAAIAGLLAWQPWGGRWLRLGLVLAVTAAGYGAALLLLRGPTDNGAEDPGKTPDPLPPVIGQVSPPHRGGPPGGVALAPTWVFEAPAMMTRSWSLVAANQCRQPTVIGPGAHAVSVAEMLATRAFLLSERGIRFLTPVAEFGPCLDIAFEPAAGIVLALRSDGYLDRFAYPSFAPVARYRLPQPGYRIALDGRRGRCYVAVSDPAELKVSSSGAAPEGRGDLHVYDLPSASPGRNGSETLKPTAVVPVGASVRSLLPSPDRSCVYYLAHSDRESWVGRVPADDTRKAVRRQIPHAAALSLSPKGRRLCCGGFDFLSYLDTDTMDILNTVTISATVSDLAVDDTGRVFVIEQGAWPQLLGFDAAGKRFHQASFRTYARGYVRLDRESDRVYMCWSSRLQSGLRCVNLSSDGASLDEAVMVRDPNPQPVCGEIFLAPGGQFIAGHSGKVYRFVTAPSSLFFGRYRR
jgi:hypothetical protein